MPETDFFPLTSNRPQKPGSPPISTQELSSDSGILSVFGLSNPFFGAVLPVPPSLLSFAAPIFPLYGHPYFHDLFRFRFPRSPRSWNFSLFYWTFAFPQLSTPLVFPFPLLPFRLTILSLFFFLFNFGSIFLLRCRALEGASSYGMPDVVAPLPFSFPYHSRFSPLLQSMVRKIAASSWVPLLPPPLTNTLASRYVL